MGINKYLKLSYTPSEDEDYLTFIYAANALRKGYGRIFIPTEEKWHELEIDSVMTFDEIWPFISGYIHPLWRTDIQHIFRFFLSQGNVDLDWLNSFRPRVELGMFGFTLGGKEYLLPLDETYELVLADDHYDPLQAYRKKSRGSLTGVSSLLSDLQARLSEAQVEPSRKEAALRKLNSLAAEMRKLNLMKEKEEPGLG